jgi:hypothetical protein
MGENISTQPIGPELIETVFSPEARFEGNQGEPTGSSSLRYPVTIRHNVRCEGPTVFVGPENSGRCFIRTARGDAWTTLNYFNSDRNRMEQLTSAFQRVFSQEISLNRCVSANINRNSDLVSGNFDFERNSDGFIVFRPMPECLSASLIWGPLSTTGWVNNGHIQQRWDSVYEGPSIWNQPQIFPPFERMEPNVLRQRSMDDPELSAIISELETPVVWAAAIQAERDLALERGFLADFDAALERGWGPILQDGRPLWIPGEFETIKDGWARLDMFAEMSQR